MQYKFLLGTALLSNIAIAQQKPNIIIILADDMGYSDLGCYGSSFYETPRIDQLFSEGIKFTQAYAASPVSSSSRASIFTGKYPVSTGVTDWIPGRSVYSNGKKEDRFLGVKTKQELA
jgi:arylsulfatase A-like enzyme